MLVAPLDARRRTSSFSQKREELTVAAARDDDWSAVEPGLVHPVAKLVGPVRGHLRRDARCGDDGPVTGDGSRCVLHQAAPGTLAHHQPTGVVIAYSRRVDEPLGTGRCGSEDGDRTPREYVAAEETRGADFGACGGRPPRLACVACHRGLSKS
jgi:hypothetical protein